MYVSVRRTASYADVSGVAAGPRASGQAVDAHHQQSESRVDSPASRTEGEWSSWWNRDCLCLESLSQRLGYTLIMTTAAATAAAVGAWQRQQQPTTHHRRQSITIIPSISNIRDAIWDCHLPACAWDRVARWHCCDSLGTKTATWLHILVMWPGPNDWTWVILVSHLDMGIVTASSSWGRLIFMSGSMWSTASAKWEHQLKWGNKAFRTCM